MTDEKEIITSLLQQHYSENGKTVEVCIYRLPDTSWTLEIVDEYNNSTVYDDEFVTDEAALALFLAEVEAEGIEAFIGPAPGTLLH